MMAHHILIERRKFMRWLPLIIILVLIAGGGLLAANNIKEPDKRRWTLVSLAYMAGLGVILFTPISFNGLSVYVMPAGVGRVNYTRLYLHGAGFIENIILTMPLGFIIKKIFHQIPISIVGLLGLVIGGGIELAQYYMSQYWLINRSSDINDIIANALGILVGGILVVIYKTIKEN